MNLEFWWRALDSKPMEDQLPCAKSKDRPKADLNSHFIPSVNGGNASPAFNDSSSSLPVDQLDGIFRSSFNISKPGKTADFIGSDDVFGGQSHFGGTDLDSFFASSNGGKSKDTDLNSRDLFGSKAPKGYGFDGLFGGFSAKEVKNGTGFDDLLSTGHPSMSSSTKIDDPFSDFQSSLSQSDASWPFHDPIEEDTGKKDAVQTSIDDLLMGGVQRGSKVGVGVKVKGSSSGAPSNGFAVADDLDTIFGSAHGGQRNSNASPTITTRDPLFDSLFPKAKAPVKLTSTQSSISTKNTSSAINVGDAFTSLFGDDVTSSEEFVEVAGEPEERRRARLNRHMRMNSRMAEALAEKNHRDLQIQREQEEKYRLSETLDGDLKRWAAGKEGNLRALLSSLQQVLWPECGWRPVSLTDMITSDSVKKVYKKATLCVHPDKVQQRGANLQQRYIAEKVFDLLKEAWTKFSSEELL